MRRLTDICTGRRHLLFEIGQSQRNQEKTAENTEDAEIFTKKISLFPPFSAFSVPI
jgi:hypothetical protein